MSQQYPGLKAILPLLLVVFIDAMGMAIIFPILTPVFMESNGILAANSSMNLRNILYGTTMCVFPVAMFFGTPILGDLSDYVGRKRILIICLLGVAASYLLSSLAIIMASVSLLIFSRIVAGLFAGSIATAQAAVIDVSPAEKKATNLSLMLFPCALGFVVGPLLGSYTANTNIVSWFGLWTPLAIASILALLNCIFLWFGFNETHTIKSGFKFKWHHGLQIFADAFRNKAIRIISIIYLCLQIGWGLYFQYISLFLLNRYHYTANHIGLFMAMIGIGFSVAMLYLVKLCSQYFTNKTTVLWTLLVSTLCLFLTVFIINAHLVWIVGFMLATSMAIAYPVMISMYSDLISADKQGWIMGVANAVGGFAWAVGAFFGGFMQHVSNSFALLIAGILMGVATLLISLYKKS